MAARYPSSLPLNDYKMQIAEGAYSTRTVWNKFGYNTDVDSGAPEIIAAQGGSIAIMTTGDTLDVVSTSANDTLAGTGARVILITGIDQDANVVEETVVMNGTSTVTTTNQFLGVNRAVVVSSGTDQSNDGNITLTDTGGTVGIQGYLPSGTSVTEQCIFHTPIGHSFLTSWLWINALKTSGGSSPKIRIKGISYSRVTDTFYDVFNGRIDTGVENIKPVAPGEFFVIGGREVLYFTAETDTNNTEVTCRFSGTLCDLR